MINLDFTDSGGINYYNTETGEGFCLVPKTRNSDGSYSDTDLSQYDFLTQENKNKIESAWTDKIKADWEAACKITDKQIYADKRRTSFPSIGEQLDLLFHDMTTDKGSKTGKWYKAIAKVKSDNPKPE